MSTVNRREFLAGAGATAIGAALPAHAGMGRRMQSGPEIQLDCRWWQGALDGTPVKLRTYAGVQPPTAQFPTAPTITTRPGDTLRVMLANNLTPYDSSGWNGDHNVPHHLNTTNLHLHGLEIIPHLFLDPKQGRSETLKLGTMDAAAPMIAIEPGASRRYVFEIPSDQPPGFFWYHPHHHGSTAVQAVTGMAGAIIVFGDIDEVPEIKAARDIPLVIQDIGLFPSETDANIWTYEPVQNAIWDTFSSTVRKGTWDKPVKTELRGGFTTGDYKRHFFLVNGQPFFREDHNPDPNNPARPIGTQLEVPRIEVRPGEVIRLRMLNGNSDNVMPIVVADHDMHVIALDGVNFPAPRTAAAPPSPSSSGAYAPDVQPQVLLAPANRVEFLIKANKSPGTYRIVALAQAQQFIYSDQKTIAEIVVSGDPVNMRLPAELPVPSRHYPLIQDDEITRVRDVIFAAQFHGTQNPEIGLDFAINGTLYKEDVVGDRPPWPNLPDDDVNKAFFNQDDWTTRVGDVEEWHLSVPSEMQGGNEGHPFHIHVNSFEVHSIGGRLQPRGRIQDTIWVHKDSSVVIRMKFRQWTGKSVFHCHILPHEDTGMMKNLMILPPRNS